MGSSLVGGLVSLLLGTVVAGATVFGLVSSQTSPPSQSPGSVTEPSIPYGTN